ncbi:glycosyltransferase family 4 protein [uncultured Draconibacterium sp.]|uniref:glycosyltransferase family 4 protein n=1 Tax=uncultured Draconibacterium sp. TaxID=1573823 RepID=UPI002AA8CD4C|nr:glycosyltransferase family 4 protein [uncultured Draconibacterium sp.]
MNIIYCLPEMSLPGGIGRVTAIKSNYLVRHNHQVSIVTTCQKGSKSFYPLDPNIDFYDLGINFIDNRKLSLLRRLKNRTVLLKRYKKQLSVLIDKIKPDIVVSTFNTETSFLYKLKDGSKKILESHFNHDVLLIRNNAFNLSITRRIINIIKTYLNERLIKRYDVFVVLTEQDAKLWKYPNNLHVIPNMISFENNEPTDIAQKQVIAVGRLDAQKRFDRLIDIWGKVVKKNKEWILQIYGKGPDIQLLKNQIARKNLENYIQINKPVTNIKEKYLESSILTMTSSFEGLPLTLIEAMSLGIPCVSYSCKCGPADIITHEKNGFLIKEGDESKFMSSLLMLMENDELRRNMSHQAFLSSQRYSVDRIMSVWTKLFNETVKN